MTYNMLFISTAECVNSPFTLQDLQEIRNVSDFLAKAKLHLNFDRVNMSHRQFCKNAYLKCLPLPINADNNAWYYDEKDDQIMPLFKLQ